ncbi:MAG: TatD family hydrolase [archaeon]
MIDKDLNNYFLDIHCHSSFDIEKLQKLNLQNIIAITNSTNLKDNYAYRKLAKEKISNLYFAYGFHPESLLETNINEIKTEINKLDFLSAIAIGEIGLDSYYASKIENGLEKQKELFATQLDLAEKLDLPVIIHSRGSQGEVLDILSNYKNLKVILHWFSGSLEQQKEALRRGYYLSIRFNRPKIEDVKNCLEQIFIETDCPVNYDGKATDNFDIIKSYELFAEKNKIDLEFLKEKIYSNFKNCF